MSRAFGAILIGIALGASTGIAPLVAFADSQAVQIAAESQPVLKPPQYPNEPEKKSSEPVDPKTYVAGASSTPDVEPVIPRVHNSENEWIMSSRLRWFYASQIQDHSVDATDSVHTASSNTLSLGARADFRAPWVPVSVVLRGVVTSGTAEATPTNASLGVNDYTSTTEAGFGGLRVHLFPRDWRNDLRVGADAGWMSEPYSVLAPGGVAFDNESRQEVLILPCAEFELNAGNWSADFVARVGLLQSVSGMGGVTAAGYRRLEGEIDVNRYLKTGLALGLSAEYLNERATWTETNAVAFSDFTITQDLRLGFYIRFEY